MTLFLQRRPMFLTQLYGNVRAMSGSDVPTTLQQHHCVYWGLVGCGRVHWE